MRIAGTRPVLGMLAGAVALTVAVPFAYGQPPDRRLILRNSGSQIGVTIRDVEQAESDRQKIQGGAVIETVGRDSPAEQAGLKKGDVIVEFDGERVRGANQLSRLVDETPAGRSVKTVVVRDGRKVDVNITPFAGRRTNAFVDSDRLIERLNEAAENFGRGLDFDFDRFGTRGRLGVAVEELTPQLAEYFGAHEGVLVAAVTTDSPAARAGLKAGDVISKVDGTSIRSRTDLIRALRGVRDGGELTVGIVRDKKESPLKVKLESERPANRSSRTARPA